jgi:hypothetical protein
LLSLLSILAGAACCLAGAWAWGAVALRRLPVPHEVRLALGAAIYSTLVFLILLGNAGFWPVFLAIAVAPAALLRWTPRAGVPREPCQPLRPVERYAGLAVLATYGIWCLINALAPEIAPDGITYHLGLPAEYVRLAGFPDRIAFYGMLPQAMEMLYTAAFSIGRHSAAKLVEFAFFAATLPLLFRIGRRLGLSGLACLLAAVFYGCAPVVEITGSTSYNDAGQVFFALASFYLLLLWEDSGNARYLLPAGVLAGFCYGIKMPGLVVPAVAVAFLALRGKWKAALLFGCGATLTVVPWMLRNALLTGNPLAPMLNTWFPNPYFHLATDRALAADLRSSGGIPWWRVPFELALGGRFTGIYGPLLLALPAAVLALRHRAGRLCCALAVALALPWFANNSARFVMLAMPFAALALGLALASLPRGVTWAAIALQAVVCFPLVVDAWEPFYGFRLHEFPLAAAVRAEDEAEYLTAHLDEYKVTRMIERSTPPEARILALLSVATAYTDREIAVNWQSAEADRLLDTLRVAGMYRGNAFYDVAAEWPMQPLSAIRIRLPQAHPEEWCIHDIQLLSGRDEVVGNRWWRERAWPNSAEAPFAFDGNLATRWRTWEPMRAGMFFELELDQPQRLSAAVFQSHTPVFGSAFEFYGRTPSGAWVTLSKRPRIVERPKVDLRLATALALRRAGYRYVLVPIGHDGNTPLGNAMAGHEAEWGLSLAGRAGDVHLFRIN